MRKCLYVISVSFCLVLLLMPFMVDASSVWNYTCLDIMDTRQVVINGTDESGEYLRINDILLHYAKKSPTDASVFTDGKNSAYVLWVRPGLTIITYSAPNELPVSFACSDETRQ